jgi:hypothetical protein
MGETCELCQDIQRKITNLEDKVDTNEKNYKNDKVEKRFEDQKISTMLEKIQEKQENYSLEQKRLNNELIDHMKGEDKHHEIVITHMARTNTILESSATKEDLATTNGRVTTMWIIGGSVVGFLIIISGIFAIYVKNDIEDIFKKKLESTTKQINEHSTEASKMNYSGLAKVVRKEVREIKP